MHATKNHSGNYTVMQSTLCDSNIYLTSFPTVRSIKLSACFGCRAYIQRFVKTLSRLYVHVHVHVNLEVIREKNQRKLNRLKRLHTSGSSFWRVLFQERYDARESNTLGLYSLSFTTTDYSFYVTSMFLFQRMLYELLRHEGDEEINYMSIPSLTIHEAASSFSSNAFLMFFFA